VNIGGVQVGGDAPCRFVAEVSNNHNGSLATAHRLIDAIATIGAEFVKFQAYTPDELVALRGDGPAPDPWGSQGWSMRALYENAQTPLAWLPELFQHARDAGLVPFSSVFGMGSLAALEALDCPAYKIARLDNSQGWLAEAVAAHGKPMIVSEGRSYESVVVAAEKHRLLCHPGYPSEVRWLPRGFDEAGFLGLSSHCLDPRLPIAAVASGAKLLEYHVMLDDEPSELEANVSLTTSQFARMVEDVRATEVLCG
jgi:pseudaminic acid synthase